MVQGTTSVNQVLRGILECPLRKGFVEFEYSRGDRVRDLMLKVEEVWGAARTDIRQELRAHGHLEEMGAWVLFCQTKDGAYVPIEENDEIPCKPPTSDAEVSENRMDRYAGKFGLDGALVHVVDLRDKRRLNLRIEQQGPPDHDYAVRLVALVAISGG